MFLKRHKNDAKKPKNQIRWQVGSCIATPFIIESSYTIFSNVNITSLLPLLQDLLRYNLHGINVFFLFTVKFDEFWQLHTVV